MARVTGPLYSQEARGQFGQTVVFTRRRGQNVARSYVIPANPQTDSQVAVRISFAGAGIVTRRVRATDWTYSGEALTWIQFWTGRVTTGEVWNSAMVSAMQGPGRATYTADMAQFTSLSSTIQDLWQAAAVAQPEGLSDYTRDGTTLTAGFLLFWAQKTTAAAGYGPVFNPNVPMEVTAG